MKLFPITPSLIIKNLLFTLIICLFSTTTKGQQEYPANFDDCIKKLNEISKLLKDSLKSLENAKMEIDAEKVKSKKLSDDLTTKQDEIKSLNLQIESINKNLEKIISEKVADELKKQILDGKVYEKKDYDALGRQLKDCENDKRNFEQENDALKKDIGILKSKNSELSDASSRLENNSVALGTTVRSAYDRGKKEKYLNFDFGPDFINQSPDTAYATIELIRNKFKQYANLKDNPDSELKDFGRKSEQYLRACEILYELNVLLYQFPNKKKIDDAIAKAKSSSDFKSFPALTVNRDKFIDILGSSCAFFSNVETYYIENQKIVQFPDVAKKKTLKKYQAEAASRKFYKLDEFIDKIVAGESPSRDCK
jgi:predicted  nucleic acid-binding Zn-ribbon protein